MYAQLEDGKYRYLSGVPVPKYHHESRVRRFFNAAAGFITQPEVFIPVAINLVAAWVSADAAKEAFKAMPYYAYGLGVYRSMVWTMEQAQGLRQFSDGFSSKKYFDTRPVGDVTSEQDMKAAKSLRNQFALFGGLGTIPLIQSAVVFGLDNPLGIIATGFISTVVTPLIFAAHRYHKVVKGDWAITDSKPEQENPSAAPQLKPVLARN